MTPYQENRLSVLSAKIEKLEAQSGFVKKNLFKIIGFGILFSFSCPFYNQSEPYWQADNETIIEKSGFSYFELVGFMALLYIGFILLGHIVFSLQEKAELKSLRKQLQTIEDQIASENNSN